MRTTNPSSASSAGAAPSLSYRTSEDRNGSARFTTQDALLTFVRTLARQAAAEDWQAHLDATHQTQPEI